MRRAGWMLAALAVVGSGLFACSSSTVTQGELGFTVAESLLVLYPENAADGYVLLSAATGTCAALQTGASVVVNAEVANLDYLAILLGAYDANGDPLPLSAATYTVVDPSTGGTPPGLFALVAGLSTDAACDPTEQDASTGSVTLSPLDTTDGGSSSLNFSAVFGGTTQLTGTYPLTTCLVSLDAGVAPGTCLACTSPPDGGPCAIQ